ncbi:MAG: hypothetical protein Q9163_006163 [Psora crenata]
MPIPQPKVPLKDHCSIIHNNKLYVYQPDAFQALDLRKGGQWTQLPMGVSTTGSVCVQGSVDDQPAFIVVGGSTQEQGYKGLQHYSFSSNSWKSDTPADGVAIHRQGHGAAFLQGACQILVYGGSQDNGPAPSSQTFVLSTDPPYSTQAFSSTAPPASGPLVLPYNSTHALMLGGDPTNTELYTFSPDGGWRPLGVSLQNGVKGPNSVQATILHGSDGSKILEIFDLSVTPNQITTVLLQNSTGTSDHVRPRSYIPSPHHPAKRRKRETTLADRPAYNSTLAPQEPRTGFSLAADPTTGLVVATGGNDQVPLAIFNETGNQWIDPIQFFDGETSPASSTSAAPSTPSPTAVPPAGIQANHHQPSGDRTLTILGATLGGVFGAAVLLVTLLFLLRLRRKKREQKKEKKGNDFPLEQKHEMDFADIGADFMKEAGGSVSGTAHRRDKSGNTAKYHDRSGAGTSQSKRSLLVHAKGDSGGSGFSVWSRGTKSPENKSPPQISAPVMGTPFSRSGAASPEPMPADTGWSRYFANNTAQEMLPRAMPPTEDARPATYMSTALSQSDYGSSLIPSAYPHQSAEVEPLDFRPAQYMIPPNPSGFAAAGFQSQPGLGVALTHGVAPELLDQSPTPSVVSDIDEEDEYRHSNGQDSWSPVESGGERDSRWTDEQPLSTYGNRLGYPPSSERMHIPNFPMPSAGNSVTVSPVPSHPQSERIRGLRNVVSRDLMRSNSPRQQATDDVRTGTQIVTPSTTPVARTFPRPKEQLGLRGRGTHETEDMSWLNLGTSAEQPPRHLYHAAR